MRIFWIIAIALCLGACDRPPSAAEQTVAGQAEAGALRIVTKDGAAHDFTVEIALTPAEQARGLMNRTEMAVDHGMLFWFGAPRETSFWMKNTLIPLDMLFVRGDGTIGRIKDSAQPLDLTGVPSEGPVAAVVELNGGTAKRLGIAPGDRVEHLLFTAE